MPTFVGSSLAIDPILSSLVIDELKSREGNRFSLLDFCTHNGVLHRGQYEAIIDPAPYSTEVTTRRAGKTTGRAADHIDTALRHARTNSLYVTLTRSNAKKIFFPIVNEINMKYHLGAEPNISDLCFRYPNGAMIYLAGVNDQMAIHNFRGMKFKLVTIDEPQSMRSYIEELINDVLGPALIDEDGRLRLSGTPGPIPAGYFYDICKSDKWRHHFFTMFENPFLDNPEKRLKMELERRGVTVDDPSIQREFFGQWVVDQDSLVIKYLEKAHFEDLPKAKWEHILSVDFGFEDADALAVIAFSHALPDAYLREELVKKKQGITEIAHQIQKMVEIYKPLKIVGDFGGLGKKIAEELRRRFSIPIVAADKNRKYEYIELLNDAIRTGRFRAKSNSLFAQDANLLEWEIDYESQKRVVSDRFHSDIIDAVLYGFRESLHYLFEPAVERAKPGSLEQLAEQEAEHIRHAEEAWQAEKGEEAFWSDPFEE